MSYILNALRKSELERQANQEQSLVKHVFKQADSEQPGTSRWLIILLTLNLVFLGFFALYYSQKQISIPIKKEEQIFNPVIKTKKIEIKTIIPKHKRILAEEKKPPFPATKTRVKSKLSRRKQQENSRKPSPKNPPKKNQSVNPEKPETIKKSLPWLEELPYQFRRNVPPITINVFVFSKESANRFIMVAMQKYIPGDEIAPGMRLKEILPDSIVVKYKNRIFKIKRNSKNLSK